MKKYILDNLPTIWVIAVFVLGMALAANHANAGEKTKQEWNALYAEAGCMDLNFFQKEICKTKVFQKTNWQSGKDQLNNTFKKLGVN